MDCHFDGSTSIRNNLGGPFTKITPPMAEPAVYGKIVFYSSLTAVRDTTSIGTLGPIVLVR
jgi:hypothetical protein